MKSSILLFSMLILVVSLGFAQDMQYVHSQNGDTLVVKDDVEFGHTNTLYNLMHSDSSAPATRVYMLKAGGIYSCANNPSTSKSYQTVIMGPVQNLKKGATVAPPVVSGDYETGINTDGGMNINKALVVANIDLEIGNSAGNGGGWAFFNFGGPSLRLEVDNCIMEHTWWTWLGGPPGYESTFFNNDYFVNLDGHTCRRNGGVVDFNGTTTHQDTLAVQNCSHVNIQGTLYKIRYGQVIDRWLFNHNDFIDCAGFVTMNNGDATNLSMTNSIFVNTQLQDYCPVLSTADVGEVDMDSLAMGLINLRADSTFKANIGTHGVYVDNNVTYWDPSLSTIDATLNAKPTDGNTHWVSQRIVMNTRTTNLFADKTDYPKLVNGTWITQLPTFAKTDVLFGTGLAALKAYAIACVDTSYGTPLASWRQTANPEKTNFVFADWPIPIDLSYSDASLLTAGTNGFPVGDLGWFPTQYASWQAQETAELAHIQSVVNTGKTTGVAREPQALPEKFALQ